MKLIIMLLLSSCVTLPVQKVRVVNFPKKAVHLTRSDRYYNCVKDLNREGIKQSLLKKLCNASFGGNE